MAGTRLAGSLVSSAPPARSAEVLRAASEEVVAQARRFAEVRRQIRVLEGDAAADLVTLQVHPALVAASPVQQGWQLAEEAAARIQRAGRTWLQEDLATVVEEVFGVDIAVIPVTGWFDGVAWSQPQARVAVLGASGWPGRQRFALAHQLCHLVAGEVGSLHLDASIEYVAPDRTHTEARANAFAEAFLMPEDVLREVVPRQWTVPGFASLATWLRLPARAVAGRLHRLGLVSPADRRRFEILHGPEVAALAGATHAYTLRCRQSGRTRMPARLVHDALRHRVAPGSSA